MDKIVLKKRNKKLQCFFHYGKKNEFVFSIKEHEVYLKSVSINSEEAKKLGKFLTKKSKLNLV